MYTTVRLLSDQKFSGINYQAGQLVSIDSTQAAQLVTAGIADNSAAAIARAVTEGKQIKFPGADALGLKSSPGQGRSGVGLVANLQDLIDARSIGKLEKIAYQFNSQIISSDGTNLYPSMSKKPLVRALGSNCRLLSAKSTTNFVAGGFSGHVALDDYLYVGGAWPNFYTDKNGAPPGKELVVGSGTATARLDVTLEYPVGTFTTLTFGGNAYGSCTGAGWFESDIIPVSIKRGDRYWYHWVYQNSDGIMWQGTFGGTATTGDAFKYDTALNGANGVSMSLLTTSYSTITSTGAGFFYGPAVIYGISNRLMPAIVILGDSRDRGDNDAPDYFGLTGEIHRAIGPFVPTSNFGVDVDSLYEFLGNNGGSSTLRQYMAKKYFTDIVCGYGINDIGHAAQTLAQIQTNYLNFINLFPGIPVHAKTLMAWTNTTDAYATLVNQSVSSAPNEAIRTGLNDWLVSGAPPFVNTAGSGCGLAGVIDYAGFNEVNSTGVITRNGGLWPVNGAAGYNTTDGLHGTMAFNKQGAINLNSRLPYYSSFKA